MSIVLANGVFDYIHPGHLHYLRKSAELGDELQVVITRDNWPTNKEIRMTETDRRKVVDALEMVDRAFLGSEESIYDPVENLDPDIITLGYDQDFSKENLLENLEKRGLSANVIRISKYGSHSSTRLKNKKQTD